MIRRAALAIAARRALALGPRATMDALLRRFSGARDEHATPANSFDVANGIDASGFLGWSSLASGKPNDAHNAGYLAADPTWVAAALRRIENRANHTFVDIGAGKGRILLVAAQAGFGRVTGVEIAPTLVEIAKQNGVMYSNAFSGATEIKVVESDALDFTMPAGPVTVFLFHPFSEAVMRPFASRLAANLIKDPREAAIVYFNAKLATIFDEHKVLERVDEISQDADAQSYVMWRSRMPRAAIAPRN